MKINWRQFEKSLGEAPGKDEEELKRKRRITELQDIFVDEISFVDSPAIKKEFMIVKGDDKEMNEEKELKGWEDISEKEVLTIRETVLILSKYDLVGDLERAKITLTKYFGESGVKKYNERCEWSTIQNQLYGYNEDDLDFVNESVKIGKRDPEPSPAKRSEKEPEIFDWKSFINNMTEQAEEDQEIEEEIEKSDTDKFPSLTRGLLKGQRRKDKAEIERDLDSGRSFI